MSLVRFHCTGSLRNKMISHVLIEVSLVIEFLTGKPEIGQPAAKIAGLIRHDPQCTRLRDTLLVMLGRFYSWGFPMVRCFNRCGGNVDHHMQTYTLKWHPNTCTWTSFKAADEFVLA